MMEAVIFGFDGDGRKGSLACVLLLVLTASAAGQLDLQHLRPAKQQGASCAFFANIPALTLATGIDITGSDGFIRSIYGLRRGDFTYRRAFDKRMFCELFGLPWEQATILHPELPIQELLPRVEQEVEQKMDPGLAKGWVYSLRVNGTHGGPHNVLLLHKSETRYWVHDPSIGRIRVVDRERLAKWMLVRSTTSKNRLRPVYITQYVTISLERQAGEPQSLAALPAESSMALSPAMQAALRRQLEPNPNVFLTTNSLVDWIRRYPGVDFAAIPSDEGDERRSVISSDLPAESLVGLLHLSRFHLGLWQMKRRSWLPVLVMDGEPWVLSGYRSYDEKQAEAPVLAFHNGKEERWLAREDALSRIHRGGTLFGFIQLKPEPNSDR